MIVIQLRAPSSQRTAEFFLLSKRRNPVEYNAHAVSGTTAACRLLLCQLERSDHVRSRAVVQGQSERIQPLVESGGVSLGARDYRGLILAHVPVRKNISQAIAPCGDSLEELPICLDIQSM